MADLASPPSPTNLAPPRQSTEDPGAHELESSENEDDHFSSASEGADLAAPPRSGQSSPIPVTRVEKVDGPPSHGEIPGTDAYDMRTQDAVPDEVEVVADSKRSSTSHRSRSPSTRPQSPVPTMVVDKIDPISPSHGDVPGTAAHDKRKADAIPDVVRRVSVSEHESAGFGRPRSGSTPGDLPIPSTKVSKVDGPPSHGEVPGTEAYKLRTEDARPDEIEGEQSGSQRSPTSHDVRSADEISASIDHPDTADTREATNEGIDNEDNDSNDDHEDNDGAFGEDFDDFEEGGEESDFGDFDDGFQLQERTSFEDQDPVKPKQESKPSFPDTSAFPMLNFEHLKSVDEVLSATKPYMDHLFPLDETSTSLPPEALPAKDSIFLTDRSLSLWSQLVATPPLQPPNWVRSRIRRLFLVSLGVPVDLDEILPASKQKKLVLPSTHLSSESQPSSAETRTGASIVKNRPANSSSTSVNSSGGTRKRRGPPPVPELDLSRASMLCATTDAALANLTEEELRAHLQLLEDMTRRSSEALEYWLKRKDGAIGDKEAFEGVIENLVKHARKVRK